MWEQVAIALLGGVVLYVVYSFAVREPKGRKP
jgi:hypothetical protein